METNQNNAAQNEGDKPESASHEVHPPATPGKVETTLPKTRTRAPHQENCACGVCKKKRAKEEKANDPGEQVQTKEQIIEEYLKNLPDDRDIIVFEAEAKTEISNNLPRLKEKYPQCKTAAELVTKIINECVIKFSKAL